MNAKFFDYVKSFYGPGGLNSSLFDVPVSDSEINAAIELRMLSNKFEGDSVDREMVRDLILMSRGLKVPKL